MLKFKLTEWALFSRLVIVAIQFNNMIPDHDAGVFVAPTHNGSTTCDLIIQSTLGGFSRWDAQYFLHIAEHGYTYEQSLAFYPLFPFTIGYITQGLSEWALPVCSFRELSLLVAVFLNILFFIQTVKVLHALTFNVFNDKAFADTTSILFCINPATIFFSAAYTETFFAFLTFSVMKSCQKSKELSIKIVIPICFSILCRSNGVLNLGFVFYYGLQQMLMNPTLIRRIIAKLFLIVSAAALTFGYCQWYFYDLYCSGKRFQFPQNVVDYGRQNQFVMPGIAPSPPWCSYRLPLSYSYIQSHYWDVGFLKYYQFKQIPNFLLALPILSILYFHSIRYFVENKYITVRLNLFNLNRNQIDTIPIAKRNAFVFVVHAFALTIICTIFVHIQVSTRMLISSSPYLFWIFAKYFQISDKDHQKKVLNDIATRVDIKNWLQKNKHYKSKLKIIIYCLSYCIVGTVMFSNFLPWT